MSVVNATSLLLLGVGLMCSPLVYSQERIYRFAPQETERTEEVAQGRSFEMKLGLSAPVLTSTYGLIASFGWRPGFVGIDLRFSVGSTRYASFWSPPDLPEPSNPFGSTDDLSSEINRPRSPQDAWGFLTVEPGISVAGRLFVDTLPLFSQSARVGLALGRLNDKKNSINFSTTLVSFEGALQCQLGLRSPWRIEVATSWYTGVINSSVSGSSGRLPVSWIIPSIALDYSF